MESLSVKVLPGDKGVLSLSLRVVPLLLVVIILFEATVFPRCFPLLGPVPAVAVVVGDRVVVVSLSGPGPAPALYANPPDASSLFEPAVPLFVFLLPVSRLRKFGPEAVRRQAPLAAAAAVSAPGPSPRSAGPGAARLRAAVRARPVRLGHRYSPIWTLNKTKLQTRVQDLLFKGKLREK